MIDESSRLLVSDHSAIVHALTNVASALDIGPNGYQVAVYGYSRSVNEKFDLDAHTNKQELLTSLANANLLTRLHYDSADASTAVEYLTQTALTPIHGDRANYPDIVVFITDPHSASSTRLSALDRLRLANKASAVMVVSIGSGSSPVEQLGGTVVHIPNNGNVAATLTSSLLNFIQHC